MTEFPALRDGWSRPWGSSPRTGHRRGRGRGRRVRRRDRPAGTPGRAGGPRAGRSAAVGVSSAATAFRGPQTAADVLPGAAASRSRLIARDGGVRLFAVPSADRRTMCLVLMPVAGRARR